MLALTVPQLVTNLAGISPTIPIVTNTEKINAIIDGITTMVNFPESMLQFIRSIMIKEHMRMLLFFHIP